MNDGRKNVNKESQYDFAHRRRRFNLQNLLLERAVSE